jgi:N-acetylneuraminic acid mutarotase
MLVWRAYLTSAVVDGKIYAIGGNCGNLAKDAVEMYDPATDTWATKTPLSKPGTNLRSAVINNKIYLFGWGTEVYEYDPVNDN